MLEGDKDATEEAMHESISSEDKEDTMLKEDTEDMLELVKLVEESKPLL